MNVATIQNINGQAITLHVKHKDKRDPKQWKGFKFAVPFDYSMHNFLLRYYVAEHGLDPDTDIQIRVTPPPEMVANCAPGTSMASSAPILQPACRVRRGRLHPHSVQGALGRASLLRFGVSDAFIKRIPTPSRRSTARCSPRRRWRASAQPAADRRGDLAAQLS